MSKRRKKKEDSQEEGEGNMFNPGLLLRKDFSPLCTCILAWAYDTCDTCTLLTHMHPHTHAPSHPFSSVTYRSAKEEKLPQG